MSDVSKRIEILQMAEAQGKPLRPEHKTELDNYRKQGLAKPLAGSGAGGTDTTEGERTAAFLTTRLVGAEQDINAATKADPTAAKPGIGAAVAGVFGDTARRASQAPERRQVEDAQMDALDAALTLGTGAAYTREQLEGYRKAYFPAITDDQATIASKKARFDRLIAAARVKAGAAAPQIDAAMTALNGPPKIATPEDMDAAINKMIAEKRPAAEIRALIQSAQATLTPQDDAALNQYDKARDGRGDRINLQSHAKPYEGPVPGSSASAAIIGAGDVLTMGGLDEVAAAAGALLPIGQDNVWNGKSFSDAYDLNLQQTEGYKKDIAESRPGATMVGQVAGLAGGAVALPAAATARLAQGGRAAQLGKTALAESVGGAAYGFGSDNSNRARGAAAGAVAAPVGSLAGRAVVKGVSRVMKPHVQPVIRRLTGAGVTLTPGQIGGQGGFLGRIAKGFEDRLAGLPVVGEMVNNGRRVAVEQLNRAAIDESLVPIGAKLPDSVTTGHDAIAWAQKQVSNAYDAALSPLQAQVDTGLQQGLAAVNAAKLNLPKAQQEAFDSIAKQEIAPFIPANGQFNGEQIQAIKQTLDGHISSFSRGSPSDRLIVKPLEDARDEFMAFARRSDPTNAAAYDAADDAFANFVRVERAAANAKGGVFSPEQLRTAVRQSDRSARKRGTAAGNARMQDLSEAASRVLPSSVPDSGTAGRLMLPALAGAGAAGGYAYDGTGGALTGAALLAAPYSSVGRRAIQGALVGQRPNALLGAGDFLSRNAGVGGAVGAVNALNMVPR
jgi:hypothetical protein